MITMYVCVRRTHIESPFESEHCVDLVNQCEVLRWKGWESKAG